MSIDYRELYVELFGTDDVDAAKELYGILLKISFTHKDVESELERLKECYKKTPVANTLCKGCGCFLICV